MCRLRNIALQCDRRTDGRTDGQTTDKVIPMCRYASQATQKVKRIVPHSSHLPQVPKVFITAPPPLTYRTPFVVSTSFMNMQTFPFSTRYNGKTFDLSSKFSFNYE